MKRKGYPKYKSSGVDEGHGRPSAAGTGSAGAAWLGEVPEGWEVKKLKHICQLLTLKTENKENPIALENIESWTGRFIETETEFEGEGIAFRKNDVLFGKLRPYLAKVLRVDKSGEAVGDFFVLRPKVEIASEILTYILRSREYIEVIDGSTFGAKMPRASWEFMGALQIPLPPLHEQKAIASYLDRETSRIDSLLSKKQRLIELLKEKRTALISRAVTKGLYGMVSRGDTSASSVHRAEFAEWGKKIVKYKPSGVEWLGEVPVGWAVLPIKYICDVRDGTHETPEYINSDETGFPLVTSKDLRNGILAFEQTYNISENDYESISKRSAVNNGDILMPMIGTVGGAVLVESDEKFAIKNIALFKKSTKFDNRWLKYHLNSDVVIKQFDIERSGGVQSFVALGTLRNLTLILPPLPEQKSIAAYLDRETAKLDTLVSKVETVIAKLKEYRTALISAAVTGKIDVREAA